MPMARVPIGIFSISPVVVPGSDAQTAGRQIGKMQNAKCKRNKGENLGLHFAFFISHSYIHRTMISFPRFSE